MTETAPLNPEGSPEYEEVSENFFAELVENLNVIDSWEDDGSNEKNSTTKEPRPSGSSRDGQSGSRENKRSKSPARVASTIEKRRTPPALQAERRPPIVPVIERKRSPVPTATERRRHSPPRRRSRSPMRRRSPPRRRDSLLRRNVQKPNPNRPSFFEEITTQIPALKDDLFRGHMQQQSMQFYQMNPMMQQGIIQGPPMMMNNQGMIAPGMMQANFNPQAMMLGQQPFMVPQPSFPNGDFAPRVEAFNRPPVVENFCNPMVPDVMFNANDVPRPVPAPKVPVQLDKRRSSAATNEGELEKAQKKAFEEGNIGLIDFLRQVSQKTSKNETVASMAQKRAKVQERCRKAAQMIKDGCKVQLPFVLRPSKDLVLSVKDEPNLKWKSPLILSDSNAQFVSCAKPSQSRDAVLANPLRNISGDFFPLARHFGVDLVETSIDVEKCFGEEQKRLNSIGISSISINTSLRTTHRGMQTETLACVSCEQRSTRKFATMSTQVQMPSHSVSTQYDREPGSFNADFDAKYMETISMEQQRILVEFCRVFHIDDHRFGPETVPIKIERAVQRVDDRYAREPEDRLSYANPENPNAIHEFISLSPRRLDSPSPSRSFKAMHSPKRRRLADRLGGKVESPQFSRGNEHVDYRPPRPVRDSPSPSRYANRSPPTRRSPPRKFSRDSPQQRYHSPPSSRYARRNSPSLRHLRDSPPARHLRDSPPSRYQAKVFSNEYRIPSPPRGNLYSQESPRRGSPPRGYRHRSRSADPMPSSYARSHSRESSPVNRRGRY